jgi:hypothetical protein
VPILDELQVAVSTLLEYSASRAESAMSSADSELASYYPKNQERLRPTRLANIFEVHREYGLNRYELDIDALWFRLLQSVKKDENFTSMVEDSKTHMDFAIAMISVMALTTIVWLIPSSIMALSPYPFLALVTIGPLLSYSFYKIVQQHSRNYTELVRSAIDLYRFELLSALHVELPVDSKQEKKLWKDLSNYQSGQTVITYKHKP